MKMKKNNSEKVDSVDAMKANPEIKQNDSKEPENKAEKDESAEWEVIKSDNKSQKGSKQAESDVHGIIQNMAKNYIENGDLSIFPLNFPYVKAGCGVEENYNKELPKVLKELKEHLIKKGLGKEDVETLFENVIKPACHLNISQIKQHSDSLCISLHYTH